VSAREETLQDVDPEERAWLGSYLDLFAKKHAHELAEKQRLALADEGYELGCICGGCGCCLAEGLISLIDPKKEGQ
jgi:hypothetical protein